MVKLTSLKKLNALELQHRAFKSGEVQTPTFHAWFHDHYHLNGHIFCKSVIQHPRIKAGMGNPPPAFYNNRSKSINRVLKQQVDHKKCRLPHFIDEMYQLVMKQMNMKHKADHHDEEWHPKLHTSQSLTSARATVKPAGMYKSESMPTHTLSQLYDRF